MTSGSGSGAAAEQEDHEQDGDGHTQRPEQDVAHLAFLLATPLLKLFHASLQEVDAYRQQSPCLRGCGDFHYRGFALEFDSRRAPHMSSVLRRAEQGSARAEIDITSTRPGTPGGRFMRQFWLAVHRSEDLAKGHAKPIRIMSEDYTLYRGESGRAQVFDYRCPHRGAPLHLGWVEGDALRCLYHGWKFDCGGQCIEMPAEDANFARKVAARSFPTREHMGLVFAYFGEGEPPAWPPYPAPSQAGVTHCWNVETVPCNWLQCYENTADEVHVAFVHRPGGSHAKLSADLPIITAHETDWGMLRFGTRPAGQVRHTPKVMDLVRDVWKGRCRLVDIDHPELAMVQDIAVQAGQGRIADRNNERLGRSDAAIILWRRLLARELAAIAAGRPTKKWT